MTTAMNDGRQADTERRRTRVKTAIIAARRDGTSLTASAIARTARVDRTFFYRHRDLLDALHTAAHEPATQSGAGLAVTSASLQADLANAGARSARLAARVHQLEERLSKALGQEVWKASGLGPPSDIAELTGRVTRLEQRNVELTRAGRTADRTRRSPSRQPRPDPSSQPARLTVPADSEVWTTSLAGARCLHDGPGQTTDADAAEVASNEQHELPQPARPPTKGDTRRPSLCPDPPR
ncbi:hypothetical protein [Streptomyces sp. NPDC023588]|uniref:hypothetical protein n=1 Tax=Streptomyces sp. NPDC023588 TaxID=3154907 RepID=UPI0033CB0583